MVRCGGIRLRRFYQARASNAKTQFSKIGALDKLFVGTTRPKGLFLLRIVCYLVVFIAAADIG